MAFSGIEGALRNVRRRPGGSRARGIQEERLCCNKITSKSVRANAYTGIISVEGLSMCSAFKHVYINTATETRSHVHSPPYTQLLSLPCLNSVLVVCTETAELDVQQPA